MKMKALKPFETSGTNHAATVSRPRRRESLAAWFRDAPAPCRSAVWPLKVVKPAQTSVETVGLPAGFEPWFPNYIIQPTRRVLTWKCIMWRRISQPSAERSCVLNTRYWDSGQCSTQPHAKEINGVGACVISGFRRTAPFWAISQPVVVITYRRFGTTHRSHLQGPRIQKGSR
jgi:hypothetical protein